MITTVSPKHSGEQYYYHTNQTRCQRVKKIFKESVINPTLAPEPPIPVLIEAVLILTMHHTLLNTKYFTGTLSPLPVATYFTGTGHCCFAVGIFLFSV